MKAKLYGYWRSSASWRVRWAFELKKIPYEYIPVNILKEEHIAPAHLRRNPMGALPVLEAAPGHFLTQSMAILFWLEENHASAPYLFGQDRTERYRILELSEMMNADTAPLQTPRVQKVHSSDPAKKTEWARHFIKRGLEAFEKQIAKNAGPYCLGKQVSAADLFLIPQIYNAKRFEISLDEFPSCKKVWEYCTNTPECIKSSPEKQSDAAS